MKESILEVLSALFTRDLNKLKREIKSYQSEENLWIIDKEIKNSGGNLCLHLVGNINTYIAAEFGKNGYIRQREFEFSGKDIPKSELIQMIDQTIIDVKYAFQQITPEVLKSEYPILVFDKKTTTEFFLVHLATHLTYHLGQINYHRRLLDQ